ncbi:MAG TPA: AAA family ATPase, partial [bacterium]|nr:AAA family ATPase [bacterium]
MYLEALAIRAFRNLAPTALALGPGVNFFYGANGQGKTNLLEACALLTNGSSPRTSVLAETIPWGAQVADLGAREIAHRVTYRVTMVIRSKGRTITVDGTPRRTVPGLAKGCLALTFLPEDLAVLTGEPALRRSFLDSALALIEPAHTADLRAYQGALLSRTRVLKDAGGGNRGLLDRLLAPYEAILIERGAAIARRRAELAGDLARALQAAVEEFALPVQIGAAYAPHLPELLDPSD